MRNLTVALSLMGGLNNGQAAWRTVFEAGVDDTDYADLAPQDNTSNPPPGSALNPSDDDTYLAGLYPLPVGLVPVDEMTNSSSGKPVLAITHGLGGGESTRRIHFVLPTTDATATARLRVLLDTAELRWFSDKDLRINGTHDFTVRLNGTLVVSFAGVTAQGVNTATVDLPAGTALAGPNVLEFKRTGGSPVGYAMLDRLKVELNPTANRDTDADGLPEWWEGENGLSDLDAADAARDADGDGLTALQERARGSHPLRPDTDGDGLRDDFEPGLPSGTSPILSDTDGDSIPDGAEASAAAALTSDADADGTPDSWETHQGTLPLTTGDGARLLKNVVGLKFNYLTRPGRALERFRVAGVIPQLFWNNSRYFDGYDGITGTTAQVVSPVAETLVDGTGNASPVTLAWSCLWPAASGNSGNGAGRLTDAMLWAGDAAPASVTLSGIPWAVYDVYVYVGGTEPGLDAAVRLNGAAAGERWLNVDAQQPVDGFQEAGSTDRAAARRGNYVRFRRVSGTACTVSVHRGTDYTVGLGAVQIVDLTADGDGDGIPDWYEAKFRLDAWRNDAAEDRDGDGLTNREESARETDPRLADTDGDGLTDFVETNSGKYSNAALTGTDPLRPDTDGDGVGDGQEVSGGVFFSNPLLADTDGDGMSDRMEILANTDPSAGAFSLRNVPVRHPGTGAWTWVLDGLQVVVDHDAAAPVVSQSLLDRLVGLTVRNPASGLEYNGWRFSLDNYKDGLRWRVEAGAGCMAYTTAPTHGLSIDSESGTEPTATPKSDTDLTRRLGFTGLGRADISDRLRIQMDLAPPAAGRTFWSLRVRVWNLDRDPNVPFSDVFIPEVLASASMQDGSAYWVSHSYIPRPGELQIYTRPGVTAFLSPARLDTTATYAPARDSDEDGLPDVWETSHQSDPSNPLDAVLDPDRDGLNQLQELALGTDPRQPDTDGDGVPDGAEAAGLSDPRLATSRPFLWTGLPGSALAGDFDQNGLPDAWEAAFSVSGEGPGADADGDGRSNAEEAAAGTDPYRADSALRAQIRVNGAAALELTWPGLATKRYTLRQSPALNNWLPMPVVPSGPDSRGQMHAVAGPPGQAPQQFFQVQVSERDTDGDGVNDWTENLLETNPASASSTGSPVPVDNNLDGIAEAALSSDLSRLAALAGDFQAGPSVARAGPVSPAMAARFLTQASFGPTLPEIERVRRMGYAGWIQDQITQQPPYFHSAYLKEIREDFAGARLDPGYATFEDPDGPQLSPENLHTPFLRAALQKSDQLRQRIALALSQIFVVSRRDSALNYQSEGLANYYDIFVRHAFGNYREVLREVTFHPTMGRYLSHIGNQKARPALSQFPDENFAREIMQLFTVGLWQLHPDGSRRKNAQGQDLPTYVTTDVTELGRVFTGFWYGGREWGYGGARAADFTQPMDMHPLWHDFDRKQLLGGAVIPARNYSKEGAIQDVEEAIDILFQHPNTPPFVCRQLIQFFVTSNPTPAYIERVQNVFVNDGTGQRGNLGAVIRTILLDPEARSSARLLTAPEAGMLREPILRYTALLRAMGVGQGSKGVLWWDIGRFINTIQQKPLYSPSVFNFFRPDYRPPGLLSQRGLSAPAFQLADSSTTISYPNAAWEWVREGVVWPEHYQFPPDLSEETALAATPERLLDRLNLLLCQGLMSPATRSSIIAAVNRIPADRPGTRARVAIWLAFCGPEGAVLR